MKQKCMFVLFIMMIGLSCSPPKPVKIGYVGCLTGRLSDLGISGRNGAMLAVEETNHAGGVNGRPIELLIKNNANNPELAHTAVEELAEAGVKAIVGPMTSEMCLAMMPAIEERDLVLLSPTVSSNELLGLDDNFFRVMGPLRQLATFHADHLIDDLDARRVAVIYDLSNQNYTKTYHLDLDEQLKERGGSVTASLSYVSKTQPDFNAIVDSLMQHEYDALVLMASSLDAAMICQHLKKHQSDAVISSSAWAMTDDFIQHGGRAVEGVTLVNFFNEEVDTPRFKAFEERFFDRFGTRPNHAMAQSYDATRLLLDVLADCRDTECIRQSLQTYGPFEGMTATYTIDQFGDADRQPYLSVVESGRFKTIR